ncbi:MAG: hypothetical protein KCHDKBKB_03121 [Elusimicrobia bacterium]|nr:hypothetical protein [Elusimicrobiota bacterium]
MSDVDKKQSWFAKHKILTGFLVIILIGMIGNAMNGEGASTTSTTASPTPVATQEITYEKVDAKSFIAEFDENQLSAESKYKSKYVELKAKIKNISEDIGGTPFLSLEPANAAQYYMGTTIKCSFKSKDELMNVKNDQAITIRGQVKSQTLGIITFDKCSISQ